MAKPLNEFGGWLTLFRISNLLGAALLSAAIVFLSMATMMHLNLKLLLESFLIIAESSLTLYFIVKILRALKIKEGLLLPEWVNYSSITGDFIGKTGLFAG